MMDEKGRVWFTGRIRQHANPDYCKEGGDHPSAKVAPLKDSPRHLSMYDPKTEKWTLISTCFSTHHLYFGYDANNTLWTSQGQPWQRRGRLARRGEVRGERRRGEVAGLDAADHRHQRQRQARRLCRARSDPVDPTKDKRVMAAFYGVQPSPVDDSIWGQAMDVGFSRIDQPGYILRLVPGSDPANTALTEVYLAAGRRLGLARHRLRPTAWCGCRSRAATRRASTAASARVR